MTTTPAPWKTGTGPHLTAGLHGMVGVYSPNAPAAIGIEDPGRAAALRHHVASFVEPGLAEFVVIAANLADKTELTAEEFDALERSYGAVPGLEAVVVKSTYSDNTFDLTPKTTTIVREVLDLSTVDAVATGAPDGSCNVIAIFNTPSGRAVTRRLGVVVHGDGTSARDDAQHIVGLITSTAARLDELRPTHYQERGIGLEHITLDADRAEWFDARHWDARAYVVPVVGAVVGVEIVERGSNRRLADLILELDGVWQIGRASANDYRRHRLAVVEAAKPHTITMPQPVFASLQAAATAAGQDLGHYLAERCAP